MSNKKSLKAKGKNKVNGKGNDKKVYIPKPNNPKPTAKECPTKDDACHHCKEGFRIERKLKQGALCFTIVNYYTTITRGVVSVSRLVDNGFVQCFTDYGISVSKNGVLYFNVVSRNGIYEIDMHDLVPNVNSIYNLQQDGLLKSTDDESFDKCESCLSGKMTKKPFLHSNERAKDLLGIIHTDVCGPLRHVSRQGASYFITFTDDYSRYGYVYLLKHKLTPPYTPQHNGVSERRNRTLLDMVRSMMNLTTLPLSFWDYALESATRIYLTWLPTKKGDKGTYELWYGKVPNLSYLKVWGCEALVKRDTPDKTQTKNLQEIRGGQVVCEVIQEEEDTTPSEITSNIPQEVEGFKPPQPPQEEVILIYRFGRTHQAPNHLCLNVKVEEHSLGDLNEPTSYKAVMLDSESNKWIDAMNAEIQSMMDNMVWVLVDLPPGCKTVGTKGYTQLYGVDYEETFSPVADIRAIRILISIAAYYEYEIWQTDVKTAFLNGNLDEDIYMVQPEGFVDLNHPRKICKLQRSIYVLKQASRSWNKRFDEEIKRTIVVECYCRCGFETEEMTIKSSTGYVFVLNGGAVDWKSSKQSTTAMSATKSEYIAASEAA
ncbi:retrotransposon protein, putative, ty1-copia subclass [Tanacetum coccineum]